MADLMTILVRRFGGVLQAPAHQPPARAESRARVRQARRRAATDEADSDAASHGDARAVCTRRAAAVTDPVRHRTRHRACTARMRAARPRATLTFARVLAGAKDGGGEASNVRGQKGWNQKPESDRRRARLVRPPSPRARGACLPAPALSPRTCRRHTPKFRRCTCRLQQ